MMNYKTYILIAGMSSGLNAMENNGKNPVYSDDEEVATSAIESPREKKSKKYDDSFIENQTDYNPPAATPSGSYESGAERNSYPVLSLEDKKRLVLQLPLHLASGFKECVSGVKRIIERITRRTIKSRTGFEFVACSSDGTLLVCETELLGNTVHVTNIATKKTACTVEHDSIIILAALSSDEKFLVTTSWDGTARVTNSVTGQIVLTVNHNNWAVHAVLSSDNSLLATGSADKTARVTSIATKKTVLTVNHDSCVTSVALSSDNSLLATGSHDKTARVTNIATKQTVLTVNHDRKVTAVALSLDGKYLATGSSDGTTRVTSLATKKTVLTVNHDRGVTSVAFSPDNTLLATGLHGGTARITNLSTEQTVLTVNHDDAVLQVVFSPDSTLLATASDDQTVRITDLVTADRIARNATLNMHELLRAFEVAARDRARIHANEQQWETWLQLKTQLPEHVQQKLALLIYDPKLQDVNELIDSYPPLACEIL